MTVQKNAIALVLANTKNPDTKSGKFLKPTQQKAFLLKEFSHLKKISEENAQGFGGALK